MDNERQIIRLGVYSDDIKLFQTLLPSFPPFKVKCIHICRISFSSICNIFTKSGGSIPRTVQGKLCIHAINEVKLKPDIFGIIYNFSLSG